jgi:hypothetical protein
MELLQVAFFKSCHYLLENRCLVNRAMKELLIIGAGAGHHLPYVKHSFSQHYPVGIDTADYAVLPRVSQPGATFLYIGAVNYIGESQKVDMCLNERLKRASFNVDEPKLLIGNMAVLKRGNQ